MGGILSNNFNDKIEGVGDRAVDAIAHSTNQLNGNIANLGNQLNHNVANVGNQLNENLAQVGNRLNDNLANMSHQLNDNLAQLGNKAIDSAVNSIDRLNDNVADVGNQLNSNLAATGNRLNDNVANIGEGLQKEVSWFSRNVVYEFGSLFDYFKVVLILLAILLALIILRYAVLRMYRSYRNVRTDFCKTEDHSEQEDVTPHKDVESIFMTSVKESSVGPPTYCESINVEEVSSVMRKQDESPSRWSFLPSVQRRPSLAVLFGSLRRQNDQTYLSVASRIEMYERKTAAKQVLPLDIAKL